VNIASIGSNGSQNIGSLLLQELNASSTSSQNTAGSSSLLEDLLTLSPAAQQLNKAPDSVIQALKDLFSGQNDPTGDLAQVKSYFQQHPDSLASVLSSLQGTTATYDASSATGVSGALLTALMNKQSSNSDPSALLSLLTGNQSQDSLFSTLGTTDSTDGSSSSIFG
jgi:hypothetical protein